MQGGSGIWVKFNFVSPKSPKITNVSSSLLAMSLMGQREEQPGVEESKLES